MKLIKKMRVWAGTYFRTKRMNNMLQYLELNDNSSIVDVSGNGFNWSLVSGANSFDITITNINTDELYDNNYQNVLCDATKLPFRDGQFDLAYSNSVIEHITNTDDRIAFAKELVRVGKGYYIQTPNYWFPVEPHIFGLFVHWIPPGPRVHFLTFLSLWGLTVWPSKAERRKLISDTVLLTTREMNDFFPDADHLDEIVLGLRKSIVRVRKWSPFS